MKLVPINCPNCGGDLKVNPEKDTLVCGYCHTEFKVDEEIKKVEINKNVNINHVYKDEAKIKKYEIEEKKNADDNKYVFRIILVLLLFEVILLLFL